MKGIVLQAPWAPLAAIGAKQWETRGFHPRTTLQPGDDLAIICGLKPDSDAPKWLGAGAHLYTLGTGTDGPALHAGDDHGDCELCPDPEEGAWSDECKALNTWAPGLLRDEGAHGLSLVCTYQPGTVLAVVTYGGSCPIIEFGDGWDDPNDAPDQFVRLGFGPHPPRHHVRTDPDVAHDFTAVSIADQLPSGKFLPGRTAWPLTNPRRLATPVPCPATQPDGTRISMQGVFTLPDHVEAAVTAQLPNLRCNDCGHRYRVVTPPDRVTWIGCPECRSKDVHLDRFILGDPAGSAATR